MSHLVQNVIHISEEKEEYGSRAIFSIPSIYHTHMCATKQIKICERNT